MTAVMRAVAQQSGPKVLRIGLVQNGRVLEERIIKQRTTVTVGANERSNFVVMSNLIASQFKLFELKGSDYYLNFVDGMTGRVALQTGISDLAALRGQAKKEGNLYQVRLTEEARGKVVIGESTFLFQFVAPPPPQPRPQLPLSVKGGVASQIDWNLTIIAAFSFVLHFGMVGALYSDWMDEPVSDDLNAVALADLVKNIPAAPPETPPETTTTTDKAPTDKTPDKAPAAAKPAGAGASSKAGPVSDKQAAALESRAEAMQMQMLAAFGGNSAVQGALNRSDIPTPDLSGVAASSGGVSNTGGDLKLGSGGGGLVQPGKAGNGLSGIGVTGGGGTGGTAGTETKTKGPTGDAQIGATSASVPVANAERVVAGLRPKFKSCYQRGLASDPGMSGTVKIVVKVAPNGEVSSADPGGGSGLSDDVVKCIARAVKNAQFDAPGGSGSTINIPVTFVQSK